MPRRTYNSRDGRRRPHRDPAEFRELLAALQREHQWRRDNPPQPTEDPRYANTGAHR